MKQFYKIRYLKLKKTEDIAEFIPYSDFYKMSENEKKKHDKYCPDMYPFLCNKNSIENNKCKRSKNDCNYNNNLFKNPIFINNKNI